VTLNIDGILYLRVEDAYKASYGVEDPEFAITQVINLLITSNYQQLLVGANNDEVGNW